jgi:hypothetical protein
MALPIVASALQVVDALSLKVYPAIRLTAIKVNFLRVVEAIAGKDGPRFQWDVGAGTRSLGGCPAGRRERLEPYVYVLVLVAD